ncbi:MAG: TIR domain-containing protein [Alphaproteobacteria bacterium]
MSDNKGVFKQINNAVLDLQSSDYQSFAAPLKKLGRLLSNPEFSAFNDELTAGLDVESFLQSGHDSQSSMVGSAVLPWPEDDTQLLGMQLLVVQKVCGDPDWAINFAGTFYVSHSNKFMRDFQQMLSQLIIPFARDYKEYVEAKGNVDVSLTMPISNKVFIVHGHDGEARETVARFVSKLGLEPIILHEQANRGRTVIEKVEANSDVGFAIVLLTPDDLGKAAKEDELEPRARQNVLLELGYFIGKLGRDKVCALKRGAVEIPSDFAGVVWESMDDAGGWRQALGRELQEAGQAIDWNKIMS